MTSLDEGAVAEAEAGSERASRAPDTRRKSPIEMERLVAGEGRARRALEDGDMAAGTRGGDDGDGGGEPGGWRSGCGSLSPVVSSPQVFLCSRFMALFALLLVSVVPAVGVNVPLLLLLRQSGDVQRSGRKQLHSLIRDLSRESACAMPGRGLHVCR